MVSVQPYLGGHRHAVVTDNDHGPILQIAMWFLMVTMILITLLRLAIRYADTRRLGLDDAVFVLAMVNFEQTFRLVEMADQLQFAGIGSAISLSLAVNHGLGERNAIRDHSKTLALQKVRPNSLL